MHIDIIVFAVIAVIVLYRLYLTLGDQSGIDPREISEKIKTQREPVDKAVTPTEYKSRVENDFETLDPFMRPHIVAIAKADPHFNLNVFTHGATVAYEMTLEAYAKENLNDLKKLLSPDLYEVFKKSVEQRRSRGEQYENTLIKLDDAKIVDAKLNGLMARLTVKFVSEQVPLLKNKEGVIIEGNPDQIDQIIDHWVFERSLKSSNPNWTIIETDA